MSAESVKDATADAGAVKEATAREAVLKALLDQIDEAYEDARTEVQALLEAQQKATGGTKFEAALPDGTKVADINLTGGEKAAKVTDEAVFIAWARETYPAERVTRIVKEVRAAFVEKLLAEMTAAGVTQVVDPETGEVHDVPGVEIKPTRKRSHSVRFKTKARRPVGREAIAEAWRAGQLAALVLPALAPAPAEQAEGPGTQ